MLIRLFIIKKNTTERENELRAAKDFLIGYNKSTESNTNRETNRETESNTNAAATTVASAASNYMAVSDIERTNLRSSAKSSIKRKYKDQNAFIEEENVSSQLAEEIDHYSNYKCKACFEREGEDEIDPLFFL